MNTLLISYDLGGPETSNDYKNLINYLNQFNPSIKPLYSFWLIKTTKDYNTISNELANLIDNNDKLFILEIDKIKGTTRGFSSSEIEYINNNF